MKVNWTFKQEMARGNIDILGLNELKCMGMDNLIQMTNYICYNRQESLRRNGKGLTVNKRVQNAVVG